MDPTDAILDRGLSGKGLRPEEALCLLREIPPDGARVSALLRAADQLSRRQFGGAGEVHAQIGLNWGYCGRRRPLPLSPLSRIASVGSMCLPLMPSG